MIEAPIKPASDPVVTDSEIATVRVTGTATDFGVMMIAVYDADAGFNDPAEAVVSQSVPIAEGEAIWTIPLDQLPTKIAIAAYHDENQDNELNRNQLGIPTERYGYSNNARGLTGPPSFKQCAIKRPTAGSTIEIFVR